MIRSRAPDYLVRERVRSGLNQTPSGGSGADIR